MTTKAAKALSALNGAEVAKKFGISRAAVNLWIHDKVPIARVYDVAELTGLEPHEIRPDIYRAPQGEQCEGAV